MDEATANLLRSWGFADYISKFKDEDIDVVALLYINESHLSFMKLGTRLRFMHKINEWKYLTAAVQRAIPPQEELVLSLDISTDNDYTEFQLEESSESILPHGVEGFDVHHQPTPQVEAILHSPIVEDSNKRLLHILKSCGEGKVLLSEYKVQQKLSSSDRRKLTQLVIKSELDNDPTVNLSADRFIKLSAEIKEIFPTESESTYYVPFRQSTSQSKRKLACGKLLDCYYNKRKVLRKTSIWPHTKTAQDTPHKQERTPSSKYPVSFNATF